MPRDQIAELKFPADGLGRSEPPSDLLQRKLPDLQKIAAEQKRQACEGSEKNKRKNIKSHDFLQLQAQKARDFNFLAEFPNGRLQPVAHGGIAVPDAGLGQKFGNALGRNGRQLHANLLRQILKLGVLRDEIGFGTEFHQNADSAGMHVALDNARFCLARGFAGSQESRFVL